MGGDAPDTPQKQVSPPPEDDERASKFTTALGDADTAYSNDAASLGTSSACATPPPDTAADGVVCADPTLNSYLESQAEEFCISCNRDMRRKFLRRLLNASAYNFMLIKKGLSGHPSVSNGSWSPSPY